MRIQWDMKRATARQTVAFAATLLLSPCALASQNHVEIRAREVERLTHRLINGERAKEGLRILNSDPRLIQGARDHSRRMAKTGFFSHDDPGFGGLRERLERARIRWSMIAENISYARNPRATAAQLAHSAVSRWMKSPGHRANILNGRLTHTGIGAQYTPKGELYLTQIFIRR